MAEEGLDIKHSLAEFDKWRKDKIDPALAEGWKQTVETASATGQKIVSFADYVKGEAAKQGANLSAVAKAQMDNAVKLYEENAPKEVKDLAGRINQGGRAVMGVVTDAAKQATAEEGPLENNKFGLGAGLLGLVLGMALGGMDMIGALLVGMLAFAVVGMMADKNGGFLGGLLGMGKDKGPAQAPGLQIQQSAPPVPAKEPAKINVRDDKGRPVIGQNPDGTAKFANTMEEAQKAKEVEFQTQDRDGSRYLMKGKYNAETQQFDITSVAAALPMQTVDGQPRYGEMVKLAKPEPVDISNGVIDTGIDRLNKAKKEAKDVATDTKAKEYAEQVSLTSKGNFGADLEGKLGTAQVNGKEYDVMIKGDAKKTADGSKVASLNEIVLIDQDTKKQVGLPVSLSGDGLVPVDFPMTSDGKISLMKGDAQKIAQARAEEVLDRKSMEIVHDAADAKKISSDLGTVIVRGEEYNARMTGQSGDKGAVTFNSVELTPIDGDGNRIAGEKPIVLSVQEVNKQMPGLKDKKDNEIPSGWTYPAEKVVQMDKADGKSSSFIADPGNMFDEYMTKHIPAAAEAKIKAKEEEEKAKAAPAAEPTKTSAVSPDMQKAAEMFRSAETAQPELVAMEKFNAINERHQNIPAGGEAKTLPSGIERQTGNSIA